MIFVDVLNTFVEDWLVGLAFGIPRMAMFIQRISYTRTHMFANQLLFESNPGYHALNVDTDLMLEVDLMCMDKQLLRVDEEIVPTCLVVCSTNGSVVGCGLCFDARKEFQSD